MMIIDAVVQSVTSVWLPIAGWVVAGVAMWLVSGRSQRRDD